MDQSLEGDQTDKFITKNNILYSNTKKAKKQQIKHADISAFDDVPNSARDFDLRKSNNFLVNNPDAETLNPDQVQHYLKAAN